MTRDQLEHAIRAACEVAGDSEVWVFGSQAILGEFPDAPDALRTSIAVDMQPKNRPDKADLVDGALGELSGFHKTHGFYVHGLLIDGSAFPHGWQHRAKPVVGEISTSGKIGWCVETHDLASSKLAAYREKDRDFVRTLLIEGMIAPKTLVERINLLNVDDKLRDRLLQWINKTIEEL
jgi:hypothetical protein